jgi:hypothetical protein
VTTNGPVGGGTIVTITGTNFSGASAVHFGSEEAASFMVLSATKVRAVSPAHEVGVVDITVTTAEGTSATSSHDHFTYRPTISALNPSIGPVNSRTLINVTGAGFVPGATSFKFVDIHGPPIKASCSSSTECEVLGPTSLPATAEVIANVTAGIKISSAKNPAITFRWRFPAGVTEVSPNEGPAEGGTTVTLTGQGFKGASAVKFGESNAASFKVNSESSITAVSPPGIGTVDVTVTNELDTSGTHPTDRFTYN